MEKREEEISENWWRNLWKDEGGNPENPDYIWKLEGDSDKNAWHSEENTNILQSEKESLEKEEKNFKKQEGETLALGKEQWHLTITV